MTITKKQVPTITKDQKSKLEQLTTVSDKIRLLNKEGYSRSDISRILNKRYQHVRNVLTEDLRKSS